MLDDLPSKLLRALSSMAQGTILSPVFLLAVGLILLWERLAPVDEDQGSFSTGFLTDGVWVVLALLFQTTAVVVYARLLKRAYDANLGWMSVEAMARLPEAVRLVVGVLVVDLLAYFQHWLKHRVPWFWQMHAVHHSQRQLNLFTDFRFHYAEYLISRPIVLLPMLMLDISLPSFAAYTVLTTWHTRLYHANIRANFGWLRYVFITPQSHRVHHSIEREHRDHNFGVMLSIWDRLFGTQWPDAHVYPRTGIDDPAFPLERRRDLASLVTTPLRQLVYPFVAIARSLSRTRTQRAVALER